MTDKFDELPPNRYILCKICQAETNHMCKAGHYREYNDHDFWELVGYRLWVCAGCETGTLEEYYTNQDLAKLAPDGETFEGYEVISYYYPERAEFQIESKQFKKLPQRLSQIYQETVQAFNNEIAVLCAVGVRALLEGICADQGLKGGNLKGKIENMTDILPHNIVDNLHSIRFIGNQAAHELTSPEMEDLCLAIEICEDLLNYLYELDYKASSLARTWRTQGRVRFIQTERGYRKKFL